jgi:hypothetical protein
MSKVPRSRSRSWKSYHHQKESKRQMHKVDFDTMIMAGSGKPQHPGPYNPGDIFLLFLIYQRPFFNVVVSILCHIEREWVQSGGLAWAFLFTDLSFSPFCDSIQATSCMFHFLGCSRCRRNSTSEVGSHGSDSIYANHRPSCNIFESKTVRETLTYPSKIAWRYSQSRKR